MNQINFINRISQLPTGQKRKYTVISLIIPLIAIILALLFDKYSINHEYVYEKNETMSMLSNIFWALTIFGFFLFWIAVRICLWIQDGYKKDKNEFHA